MMTRTLLTMLLSALALACASCGDPREAAVEAAFYDMENAFNWRDGATVVASLSADSFPLYDGLLKHALDSDEATVKRLAPFAISEIITMRNRCERAEIEQMDGRAWLRYATEQGWYIYEDDPDRPEYNFTIGAIRIAPDGLSATARVLADGKRLHSRLEFVYEEDRWKRTLASDMAVIDELIDMWVEEMGMDRLSLLLMWEDADYGDLRDDIWRPMRQRRR